MGLEGLIGPEEFYARFAGRFFGKYRAIVHDNADPRKIGRVKVICEAVYGSNPSPWAMPLGKVGTSVSGGASDVPPISALTWIEFEQGMPRWPIHCGGWWIEAPVGKPSDGSPIENSAEHQTNPNVMPLHSQGLPDGSDYDGGGGIEGLEDISQLPNLTVELLRRGYSSRDIEKFWGGNLLRVLRDVERAAGK